MPAADAAHARLSSQCVYAHRRPVMKLCVFKKLGRGDRLRCYTNTERRSTGHIKNNTAEHHRLSVGVRKSGICGIQEGFCGAVPKPESSHEAHCAGRRLLNGHLFHHRPRRRINDRAELANCAWNLFRRRAAKTQHKTLPLMLGTVRV